jgi:hypothetical protein
VGYQYAAGRDKRRHVARGLPPGQVVQTRAGSIEALQAEWFAAMRQADFARAWRASDGILALREPAEQDWRLPRHLQAVWDGRPLADRRVLVRCYHGLGDTLQFARFLPDLNRVAAATTVWAQPALIPLLRTLDDAERMRFLPLHDGTPEVDYDVDLEIMELAHALRVGEGDVATPVPYFNVAPATRRSDQFSVGLVLAAGNWNPQRCLPRALLDALVGLPDLDVFNLQLEMPLEGVPDLSTPDVLQLARRLQALDLVITPDTMLAHLAGALAVSTWTLLPADADWRWHQPDRRDSPWYPSMRLFRQPTPGDWDSVTQAVLRGLQP